MVNPPPPSSQSSVSLGPRNLETSTTDSAISPMPPPQITPTIPWFPPPTLEHDHLRSPSTRTPNLQSPVVNGAKLGSPAPHLARLPGSPASCIHFTSEVCCSACSELPCNPTACRIIFRLIFSNFFASTFFKWICSVDIRFLIMWRNQVLVGLHLMYYFQPRRC